MKKYFSHQSFLLLLLLGLLFSCSKEINAPQSNVSNPQATSALSSSSGCVEDEDLGTHYDSLPRPTILGAKLVNNPYSVANMQQASLNLYGTTSGITENKWYVRFKPADPGQLAQLEDLDIDLFDYPLDYDVVQEGDYYDDRVTPAEEIPWLYAVVNSGFSPPVGIQYELLQRLHVPSSDEIEAEAFRITGNPVDDSTCVVTITTSTSTQEQNATTQGTQAGPTIAGDCPPGFVWDPIARDCVPADPQPPAPSPTRQPSGTVLVKDNNINNYVPVRNVRVVVKRFLKVEKTYTDAQGKYNISKEFRKANIYIRTQNAQASIRSLRRARLWQMLYAVEKHFGKFSGPLNSLNHYIDRNEDALTAAARYWIAASVHNNVQEYYDYAAQLGVGTPPSGIKILLTNWRLQGISGATPLFSKRGYPEVPSSFIGYYVAWFTDFTVVGNILKQNVDVTLGYNLYNRYNSDVLASSDEVGETAFHELTHAAHYSRVGDQWWSDFVNAELNNIVLSNNPPYGTNDHTANSELIRLGESWAYHLGHFLSDRKYGLNSSSTVAQGILYQNNSPIVGLSSHINLLEDFSADRINDPDWWVPQGLYYDLIDDRNDALWGRVLLDDNVLNYNNQRFNNALDSDIRTLSDFQTRLLNENGNDQAAGVNTIYNFYVR